MFHAGDGTTAAAGTINRGQASAIQIPENEGGYRVFAQTGGCRREQLPRWRGIYRCTLLECSDDNPNFRQCDISRIDGYNVGIVFSFTDGSCGGNSCTDPNCGPGNAFSTPTNGGASIRTCNTPGVGIFVTFTC
ncbi:hypothetical protein EXIGLDRAFT_763432 [Exidia glandulosa HHB12029]|uniref:Uncharacterized protein n=1 Tax=Exidia glandulosa HHB12029 TaxID=1314781 RepID=A0A165M0B6_EXIGL|nr:hypothetical protein EXIGLDRAFT_763432 [Exidia glandulosa HHB12029]